MATYFRAQFELVGHVIEAAECSSCVEALPSSLGDAETTELQLLVLQNLALEPHTHLNGHIFTYFRAQFELVSPVIEAAEHSSCVEALPLSQGDSETTQHAGLGPRHLIAESYFHPAGHFFLSCGARRVGTQNGFIAPRSSQMKLMQ